MATVARTGSLPFVPRDRLVMPHPQPGTTVTVVPDPDEPVEVGQPRTVRFDPARPHVARYQHADLSRPGDRYGVAAGFALLAGAASAVVGLRGLFRVVGQRAADADEERVRFASHHGHGA